MNTVSAVAPSVVPARPGWMARHWFLLFAVLYGVWVWLPFLAPIFMHAGWNAAGTALYLLYSVFCHQLPERSFFLFGPKLMYPLSTIRATGLNTINPFLLRQFIGTTAMGWKIAWSDRMISFYGGIWVFALLWYLRFRRMKPLVWYALLLLMLPILLDGGTHAVSDLAGIGGGFRDSNAWLAALTFHAFPAGFYEGDVLGSFNSIMRLATGLLAALGIVWFVFPYMEASFGEG
jgi:uncharacterized membrane protein